MIKEVSAYHNRHIWEVPKKDSLKKCTIFSRHPESSLVGIFPSHYIFLCGFSLSILSSFYLHNSIYSCFLWHCINPHSLRKLFLNIIWQWFYHRSKIMAYQLLCMFTTDQEGSFLHWCIPLKHGAWGNSIYHPGHMSAPAFSRSVATPPPPCCVTVRKVGVIIISGAKWLYLWREIVGVKCPAEQQGSWNPSKSVAAEFQVSLHLVSPSTWNASLPATPQQFV